jgi:hypothetical protein
MARWNICNVLNPAANRQLFMFDAGSDAFKLERELTCLPSERFPSKLISKGWSSLWSKKLNIAWLPAGQVFLRVLHLPATEFAETLSMVEFQLEKLSPLPVTQIVWSVEVLPQHNPNEQALVVLIAARNHVEAFLGQLENEGYQPDRLEAPMFDQILANPSGGDEVWIYPVQEGATEIWLSCWWQNGVMKHLGLIHLPEEEKRAALLKDQLLQIMWAGELEGWLPTQLTWHLVAESRSAALWETIIREVTDQPVQISPPPPTGQLAAMTARRAAQAESKSNLLPPDSTHRYRQQFIDRLWMGGLGAVVMVYLAGVLIYLAALEALKFQYNRADAQSTAMTGSYTNALQLKAQIQVLQEQLELKNAVLDGWLAIMQPWPEDLTLTSLQFTRGKTVTLYGTAPQEQNAKVLDYSGELRKLAADGKPVFSKVETPVISSRGAGTITWSFKCELNRAELE